MAAASKGLGYARGEKVMKEIRGGLPEKDANKGFLGVSIGLLIIIVFCGWVFCREGTGVCETIICMGAIYLIMLNFFIKVSKAYVIDETGVTITFLTLKYGQFISTGMSTMKWNLEQREKMRPV